MSTSYPEESSEPAREQPVQTASLRWENPAYARSQRSRREAKDMRHNQTKEMGQDPGVSKASWLQHRTQLTRLLPHLPAEYDPMPTYAAWVNQRTTMAQAKTNLHHRKTVEARNILDLLHASPGRPSLVQPFKEKPLNGDRSAVLLEPTIWRADVSSDDRGRDWPSVEEMRYEGDERVGTDRGVFKRKPPLPRDKAGPTLEDVVIDKLAWEKRDWERYDIFDPKSMLDELMMQRPLTHFEIYPFGRGCPTKDCPRCLESLNTSVLSDLRDLDHAIAQSQRDTSYEDMKDSLGKDLLDAIDEPSLF